MGYFTDDFLRRLRNGININEVIGALGLETRRGTDLLRFRCPLCHGFHTATKSKTNLARCFDCKVNFNPIDLVMETAGCNFIDIDLVTKLSEKIIREIAHDSTSSAVCVRNFWFNSILEVPYIKSARFYCKLGESIFILSTGLNSKKPRHFNSTSFLVSVRYFFLGICVLQRREKALF